MTTIHATYYVELARSARQSEQTQRLGELLEHAVSEVIELRERVNRDRERFFSEHDDPEQLREALEMHHGCRVAPVEEYCRIFDDWITACKAAHAEHDALPDQEKTWRGEPPLYHAREHLDRIRVFDIGKSSYLARRLYGGEAHRTRKCPVHQGRWSGCAFSPPACGCDLTGWLPE